MRYGLHGRRIRHIEFILLRCELDDVIDTLLSDQTRCVRIGRDDSYSIAHLELFVQSLEVTYQKVSRIASLTILLMFFVALYVITEQFHLCLHRRKFL